jgi:hypothetical protein
MSRIHCLLGRLGAHVQHSRHDPKITTIAGRAAFLGRFEREADPEGVLPPEERARRAGHLRKAYFTRLALKSAQARRRAQRQNGGAQ